jgi:glycosyltransferase involved in cell wall biosynthesis
VARNRAIPEARGEILVFVDDDIVAHPGWLHAMLEGFSGPQIACVTGRVIPRGVGFYGEEETKRLYYGPEALQSRTVMASPGWCQRVLRGQPFVGFGCNMAFRKQFLSDHALFPEDLGAGSLIGAADENYMFVQVLKRGLEIRYTSVAEVTHDFESDRTELIARARQLHAASLAFNLKLLTEEQGLRRAALANLLAGAARFSRRALAPRRSDTFSAIAKLRAYWRGVWLYWKSRRARR